MSIEKEGGQRVWPEVTFPAFELIVKIRRKQTMEQSPTRPVSESMYRALRVLLTRQGGSYRTLYRAPTFTSAAAAYVRGGDVRILPPHERPILAPYMESLTVNYCVCDRGVA